MSHTCILERETACELTKRQVEILDLIKLGHTNKAIAFQLTISVQTVKNHVALLLTKLEAYDRAHAVYIGMKIGVIE